MDNLSHQIQAAGLQDLDDVTRLALLLWPEHTENELSAEMQAILEDPNALTVLCKVGGKWVGLAFCRLRSDYVEGASGSPTGYLEGIYTEEPHRHKGIAGALLARCEAWAKARGCREFASDCELENTGSLAFHLSAGFAEANRIICFIKQL